MTIAKIIDETLFKQGRQKKWLAEQIKISYSTFLDKMKKDNFSAMELLKIGMLLNIDLNELKERVEL